MQQFCIFILMLLTVSLVSAQQKVNISGIVKDLDENPLIGANIYLNGTTYGIASNANGEFILKNIIPNSYQLCVSYAGYKKLRMEIDANANLNDLVLHMKKSEGNLGEIVVTGTGTSHHLKSAPVPTELLTKKMIQSASAFNFINLMSSVSPTLDFSPSTMGANMQLNGLGNDFIVILIDDKRVYGDMGGMNDLSRINPALIERIEVVKGASSSLYGSDAIAGVINIITKKSKNKINVESQTQYSNYNTFQQSNHIDFNTNKFSGRTVFALKQSEGWQNSPYELDNDALIKTDAMTQNAYVNRTISQDLKFKATKNLSIYGNVSHYNNDIQVPVTVKKYGYFYEDLSYSLGTKYLISKKSNISFDFSSDHFTYYYKYNQDYKTFEKGNLSLNNDQQRDAYNLKWINRINDNHTVSTGAEYVREIYKSDDRVEDGKATATTLSFYAQDEIKILTQLMLTAGLRIVKHNEFGTVTTPKISLLYKLQAFNLRGTYSRGFKAPTLKELYYKYEKGSYLYLGNTNLEPQVSNYYSFGVDFHKKWLSTSISTYQNNVDNLINYKVIDTTPENAANGIKTTKQHYNVEKARTQGIDFMFDVKLPHNFTIGGGYSYVDAKNMTNNERLPYVAQNYVNLRAGYLYKWTNYQLKIQVLGRMQGEKYKTKDESSKGYDLWKLTTIHRFMHFSNFNLSAIVGVDNIFNYIDDSPYSSYYGTINPGRTFFVGLNIHF